MDLVDHEVLHKHVPHAETRMFKINPLGSELSKELLIASLDTRRVKLFLTNFYFMKLSTNLQHAET